MQQIYIGANVFNSTSKRFDPDMAIVCESGKIEKVLPTKQLPPMPDAETFDVSGKWILPGLVNIHEHQTYKRLIGPLFGVQGSFFQVTEPALTLRALRSALYSLRQGITTIFEAGAAGSVPYTMRRAIAERSIPGPRMLIAGAAFSITGGHGCELCIEVDTPDEMRKGVRRALKSGVDAIKLLASEEPVDVAQGEPVIAEISEEMVRAAVEEAHNVFKKVSIHAMGTEQLTRSIRAGVDIINHGAFLNDTLAAAMREKDITLVPTLSSYRLTAHPAFQRGEAWSQKHKLLWPAFDAAVAAALREGVSIAIGTDSIGDFHHELAMLHRRGMENADCLLAATLNGAKALGIDCSTGSIEVGKAADFFIIQKNPLVDLDALKQVEVVVKAGDRYTPAQLMLPDVSGKAFVESFPLDDTWM